MCQALRAETTVRGQSTVDMVHSTVMFFHSFEVLHL